MKSLLVILLGCLICSCESPNDTDPLLKTKDSFESPKKIGTLPDGRLVKVVVVDRGNFHDHYIYFVDGSTSTNRSVSSGKSTVNQVVVEIDGVKYVPVESVEH